MTKTKFTSTDVTEAQRLTNQSLRRFEKAMDHLADKVDHTSLRIQRFRKIAGSPKRLYRRVSMEVDKAWAPVRKKPGPFILSGLGFLAFLTMYSAIQKKRKHFQAQSTRP